MTPDPKYFTKSNQDEGIFQARFATTGKRVPAREVARMMKTDAMRKPVKVFSLLARPQLGASESDMVKKEASEGRLQVSTIRSDGSYRFDEFLKQKRTFAVVCGSCVTTSSVRHTPAISEVFLYQRTVIGKPPWYAGISRRVAHRVEALPIRYATQCRDAY